MNKLRVVIVLVLAGGAAGLAWYLNQFETAEDAYYGYVEGEYVYLSAPVSGVLNVLNVQRGGRVEAGDQVFALDTISASAEVARTEAAKARAEAELEDLMKGARTEEINVQEAELDEARAVLRNAEIELVRQEELKGTAAAVKAKLDTALAARDQAKARVAALQAGIAVAHLPARDSRIDAARRAVAEAGAAVESTKRRLTELKPVAPGAAMVADTYYLQGAWVPANMAVVSLLPDDKRKLRFFVPQGEIAAMQIGKQIAFTCDGCAEDLKATVTFIAPEAEYTPPVIYSAESREKLVFMVEAQPVGGALLPVGLPVEVVK